MKELRKLLSKFCSLTLNFFLVGSKQRDDDRRKQHTHVRGVVAFSGKIENMPVVELFRDETTIAFDRVV